MKGVPSLEDVHRAQEAVAKIAHQTPFLLSRTFSAMTGLQVFLKAENLQRTGSFKVRGAAAKIARLTPRQRARGVIAASAGNHAQGVALAAQEAGIPCRIVMPHGASLAKVGATRGYGAQVLFHGITFDEAQSEALRIAREEGPTLVHAFDDPDVIAGQGTLGLELVQQAPDLDAVLVPVGGGGLISGVALVMKTLQPRVRIIGVQTESAPASAVSFRQRRRVARAAHPSIADGIAVGQPGRLSFRLMQQYVDDMVTVSEEEVAHAVALLLERAKLMVEGAGAAPLAALLHGGIGRPGQSVAVLLTGGNVDLNLLARVLDHGLAHAGRYLMLRVVLLDQPGQLARLLEAIAEAEANVLQVNHQRFGTLLPLGQVQVEVTAETRDREHAALVARRLEEAGYIPQVNGDPATSTRVLTFITREVGPT